MSNSKFSRRFIIRPTEHLADFQYASANANPQATAWPSLNTQLYRKSIQKRPGYTIDRVTASGDPVMDCILYTKYNNNSYSLMLSNKNLMKREPDSVSGGTWSYLTNTYIGGAIDELILNGGFDSETTSWTATDCSLESLTGGLSGNCLTLTKTGGSLQNAYQIIDGLTVGLQYVFNAYVKTGTAGNVTGRLVVADTTGSEEYHTHFTSSTTWTKYSVIFTPVGYTSFKFFLEKSNSTNGTMLFDSASVRLGSTATVSGTGVAFTDSDLTTAEIEAGDKFILDDDHDVDKELDADWAEVKSVTNSTNLVLTSAYTGSATNGTYKIRKVYSTPVQGRWAWAISGDKFCFTNGQTNVQYWDGVLGYAVDLNATSASRARYCLNYADRLFLADLYFSDDGGVTSIRHPWTLRWSAQGKPGTYLADGDTTSGDIDFLGTEDVITGLGQVGQTIVVYKYNTLIFGSRTGVATSPVEFPIERRGMGCIAPYSIVPVMGTNVFLGSDNFYSLNGDIPEQCGDKIRDKFFNVVSATAIKRVWGKLLPNQKKIMWVAETNSGDGQLAFVYDYGNREWATWKYYEKITGIGECA